MALSDQAKQNKLNYIKAYNKKVIESGKFRSINLKAETPILDEFDSIAKELNLTRPQALKALCELYRKKKTKGN